MIGFLEKMKENAEKYKDHLTFHDAVQTKGITYGQFEYLSGKVYSYLQAKGIGKEDFVLICLPRGIQPIIALAGVWKNGSAFVIVEDNYAPERIEYIKKDCGCKVVIDSDTWLEIQSCDYKEGFEPVDEKAAAFAVYTSGTTGNPKGVVHEYGNIERMIKSVTMTTCDQLATPKDRFALVAPLNFIASLLIICYALYYVVPIYVVEYSIIKNPLYIGMYMLKNKITGTFLTPSYIRKMTSKPPSLKFCIIGSEPAREVYMDGLDIHNFYLMSESGFAVTHFLVDKLYKDTPVGKSEFSHDVFLLDENGNRVADGEKGEVCFENKFVRGYTHLPEETEKVFKDGIYHTGDLAYKDENGDFVICGRLNDMVKINGNRVEPGEIEGVAKKVLGVDWTAARIIDNGSRVFICVYYLKKMKVDFEKTREEMAKYLPYYMLPSFFIHIDDIPLRPNGKLDRKALPEPDFSDYVDDYVAPRDDIEKALCNAFSEVLKIDRVGIKDDFYQLGGDSMASMEVLVKSKINGLSASDIFSGHTPEKIAAIYKKKFPNGVTESDDERDDRSKKRPHILTAYQTYMIDYQLYTPMSTMLNLFTMLRFDKERYETQKMAGALLTTIRNHPALCTMFTFNDDGEMIQSYHPELVEDHIEVEKISEEELSKLKDTLVKPFKIMNNRLYRMRIFETEEAGYIFFDVHHTVFDGTSFKVIMGDIIKAYYGMKLDRDYYYMMLSDHEKAMATERYFEDKKYFEELYDGDFWSVRPKTDFKTRENTLAQLTADMAKNEEAMQAVEKKYKIGRNAFFSLVSMLSIAIYNQKSDIQISWTYNGRDDIKKLSGIGLLLNDLPVAVRLEKKMFISTLYQDVQKQIAGGIEHNSYPYTMLGANAVTDDLVCFLYQEDIRDGGDIEDMDIETVDIRQNKAASENVLDIQILDGKDGLGLVLDYASSRYKKESIEKFKDIYIAVTETLLKNVEKENFNVKRLIRAVNKKIGDSGFFLPWLK